MKKIFPIKLQFLLNIEIHDQLQYLAQRRECSMGEILRMLIQEAYKVEENKEKHQETV